MRNALFAVLLALPSTGCSSSPERDATAPPEDASPAGAPHESFASWEGTRVHYLDAGSGEEALVLVHGWAGSTEAWRKQFPAWAAMARTLVVDLPGHGLSDPPPRPYSFDAFADAVAAVLNDAGVTQAVIVGHSNGTPVAAAFARRHPERTLALVCIDGALKNLFSPEQMAPMVAPFRDERWREAMTGMVRSMPAPELSPEDREAILSMALATRHEAVVGGLDAALDPGGWSEAPITVPLLLILAEQPTWSADYEAWVRGIAPQVDYRVWSGVGHYLQLERPQELAQAVHEFLQGNGLLGG